MKSRNDGILSKNRNIQFRSFKPLTAGSNTLLPNLNVSYNLNGNILNKTNIGALTYKSNKPDAVDEVTNPNTVINLNQQDVTYTAFNKAQTITEGIYQYDITYGSEQQRKKTDLYVSSSLNKTRFYVGDYEKQYKEQTLKRCIILIPLMV